VLKGKGVERGKEEICTKCLTIPSFCLKPDSTQKPRSSVSWFRERQNFCAGKKLLLVAQKFCALIIRDREEFFICIFARASLCCAHNCFEFLIQLSKPNKYRHDIDKIIL
jgi:hypothetical protein